MPTVNQYRSELDELVRLANVDLKALWRQVNNAIAARELLAGILPELAAVYGSAAGTLAADWYDDLRAENGVSGRFRARVAEFPGRDSTDVLARWAVDPLFSAEPDFAAALARAEGGLQQVVADTGRETVMGSSIADPQATGWQRSASGGCGFCQVLAGRGAVYSESTVNFGAHAHCKCTAVPAFAGEAVPVKPYEPSKANVTQADRDRTRAWMRANGYL